VSDGLKDSTLSQATRLTEALSLIQSLKRALNKSNLRIAELENQLFKLRNSLRPETSFGWNSPEANNRQGAY
jgi:hypothetical protein